MAGTTFTVVTPMTGVYNTTSTTVPDPCSDRLIDESLFYLIMLVPATLIVVTFSFTQTRRRMYMDVWNGRPGLIHPMDILTTSDRFSYMCALGATTSLLYRVVVLGNRIIQYDGTPEIQTAILLVNMMVVGIVYFPVMSCLTAGNLLGYGLGSIYTWVLIIVQVIKMAQCDLAQSARAFVVFVHMPTFLCLLFLSIRIPIKFYQEYPHRENVFSPSPKENKGKSYSLEDLKNSNIGHHVRTLLKKPQEEPSRDGVMAKIVGFVLDYTYRPRPHFRYSARFLLTQFLGALMLYGIGCSFYFIVVVGIKGLLEAVIKKFGFKDQNLEHLNVLKDYIVYTLTASTTLAIILGLVGILRMFVTYRETMLSMNKGQMKGILEDKRNNYILMCSMKYSGYQVISVFWGFVIHLLVLTLVGFIVSVFIMALQYGYTDLIIFAVKKVWPLLFWMLLIYGSQWLMTKYIFIGHEEHLVLDNRRVFFITSYFIFFYNIFLGIFSTLSRIIKSIILGAIFLPRLDSCVLPQDFASMDQGYMTFMGFMRLEKDHNHPVMLTFLRLLHILSRDRRDRPDVGVDPRGNGSDGKEDSTRRISGKGKQEGSRRHRAAVFKWQTLYTLINNPDLRMDRKGYMQKVKLARELGLTIAKSDTYLSIDDDALQEARELAASGNFDGSKNRILLKEKEGRGVVGNFDDGNARTGRGGEKGEDTDDVVIDVRNETARTRTDNFRNGDHEEKPLDKARGVLRSVFGAGKGMQRLVDEDDDEDDNGSDGQQNGAGLHVQTAFPDTDTGGARKRENVV